MKFLVSFILTLILTQSMVLANFNDIYIADIQYDWIRKSEVEKESIINEIKDIIFEDPINKIENFKISNKDILKDKNYKKHYIAASAGYNEYGDNNISAFYYKKQKHIYMYALQSKKDIFKKYYYNALGKLCYIDFINGEYPDYPHYAIQYKVNGTPISAIYYVSKDTQYIFNPNGEFVGVWYKHNLYSKESKIILTRTSY